MLQQPLLLALDVNVEGGVFSVEVDKSYAIRRSGAAGQNDIGPRVALGGMGEIDNQSGQGGGSGCLGKARRQAQLFASLFGPNRRCGCPVD